MLQLSFIWTIKENTSLRLEGMSAQRPKRLEEERERERPGPLAPLFLSFSSPRPALSNVLPEVLTPVLGPSFGLFLRVFPFLVF